MKKILSTLSLALVIGATQAQVVFSSDLSNWSGGNPTDFMGTKTNIGAANVTEVTEGSVYGSSNARLANATTGHKRFSTQPLSVENGQGYEVKFWAKGQGDIRVGLFDNRAGEDAGYSPYSSYFTVNSTTVTEYSYSLAAANTISTAEFILSVRNTVAPNHLEIDSVSVSLVTIAPPAITPIYDIQYTTAPSGDSPLNGQVVLTGGIVTAVRSDGKYWIQNGNGPWSGVYVFHIDAPAVQLGDSVTFSATVTEYNGLTELTWISDFEIESSGNFFMATNVSSANANTEAYEGCLIRVSNANCTVGLDQYNEWTINDGTGTVKVDDFLYSYTPTVGQAYNITGVVDYFQSFKIMPRDANDISTSTPNNIDEAVGSNLSVYPVPAQDMITIQLDTNVPQELMITDVTGKQIERFLSSGTTRLNIENYNAGVYFITVNGNSYRFVKQ